MEGCGPRVMRGVTGEKPKLCRDDLSYGVQPRMDVRAGRRVGKERTEVIADVRRPCKLRTRPGYPGHPLYSVCEALRSARPGAS